MNKMIFCSFPKQNSPQKNMNTIYSGHSYSGIVPKECTLSCNGNTSTVAADHVTEIRLNCQGSH